MDNRMDQKAATELTRALQEMAEDEAKNRQKREQSLWQEMKLPCQLCDMLGSLKKNELDDIRRNLDLKNMSSLKKQELAERIEKLLPEKVQAIFRLFDEERYNLAKRIAINGGQLYDEDLLLEKAEYFRGYGILFTGLQNGKKVLAMPKEVLACFQEVDTQELGKIIKRNSDWIRLTQGLLYYNGALALTQLEELISKLTNEKLQRAEYIEVLQNSLRYCHRIEPVSQGFKDVRVFDADALLAEHSTRPELAYHSFTKEQLLKASEEDYVDRTPAFQRFVEWIQKNYEATKLHASEIAWECSELLQEGGELSEAMEYLETELDFSSLDVVQALTKEVVYLFNNTRKWELKGHTPHELSQDHNKNTQAPRMLPLAAPTPSTELKELIDIKTRKKVGRNDPCPCGSEKKFKKCCGK